MRLDATILHIAPDSLRMALVENGWIPSVTLNELCIHTLYLISCAETGHGSSVLGDYIPSPRTKSAKMRASAGFHKIDVQVI